MRSILMVPQGAEEVTDLSRYPIPRARSAPYA
jgi:hypothetical protein